MRLYSFWPLHPLKSLRILEHRLLWCSCGHGRVQTSSLNGLSPAVFLFVFWISLLCLKSSSPPWTVQVGLLPRDGVARFYSSGGPKGEGCGVQGRGWGAAERESALSHWGTFWRRCESVPGMNCPHPHVHARPLPPTLFGQKSADGKKAEIHCFMKHHSQNAEFLSYQLSSNYPKRVLWLPFIEFKLLQSLNIALNLKMFIYFSIGDICKSSKIQKREKWK